MLEKAHAADWAELTVEKGRFASVRAIYFDLDDTLCAYWDAAKAGLLAAFRAHETGTDPQELAAHWAEAFREFSPLVKNGQWYAQYLKSGEPTRRELMRLTLARVGIEDEDLIRQVSDRYAAERDALLSLFPDVVATLKALRGKYKLGLITNGPADVQRQEIETLGIGEYFDHIFIEGEVGEGKPLPSVMRRAEQAVGYEPQEILFVGNSYGHDIRPAIEARWRTVWIRRDSDVAPSSKSGKPEERPEGAPTPDAEIGNLADLLDLL